MVGTASALGAVDTGIGLPNIGPVLLRGRKPGDAVELRAVLGCLHAHFILDIDAIGVVSGFEADGVICSRKDGVITAPAGSKRNSQSD